MNADQGYQCNCQIPDCLNRSILCNTVDDIRHVSLALVIKWLLSVFDILFNLDEVLNFQDFVQLNLILNTRKL